MIGLAKLSYLQDPMSDRNCLLSATLLMLRDFWEGLMLRDFWEGLMLRDFWEGLMLRDFWEGLMLRDFLQGALFEFISKQYMFYTCPTGRSTFKECNIFTLFPDVLTKANSFPDTINTESSSNPVSKENKMNTILSPVL